MAEQRITQDQVTEYLRQNNPSPMPTLRRLREILGGGSLETISRGVRAYLEEQSQPQAQACPAVFSDAVSKLEAPLWNFVRPLMESAANNERSRLLPQVQAAKETVEALELECDNLRAKDAAREDQLGRYISEAGKLGRELASAKAQLEASQTLISSLQQEIEQLRSQLQTAELEKAKAQGALDAYRRALGDDV